MDWVERKRETMRWEVQKKNSTRQLMSYVGRRPTIHQQSIQRTNSNEITKTSIIKHTQNFNNQQTAQDRC
jgi:hypothetical protein